MIPSVLSLLGFAAGDVGSQPAQAAKRHVGGRQRKTRTVYPDLKPRSKSFIDEAFDLSVKEVYESLTETGTKAETRIEAAKIVKPHVDILSRKAVPPSENINWEQIQKDAVIVSSLMALWAKNRQEEEDEAEEEELFYAFI